MPYDYAELDATLDNAPRSHLVRLQYDLTARLYGLEKHLGTLKNERQRLEDYMTEIRQAAQTGHLNEQQLKAYETYWDDRGDNPTYQMIGMTFDLLSPDGWPLDQHFSEVLHEFGYSVSVLFDPIQTNTLGLDRTQIGYEEERWVDARLKWLLKHHEQNLWQLEPEQKTLSLDHFIVLELLDFIKDQRTYHPNGRQMFRAIIDQPSDTRRVWFCHIPELDIKYVPIAEPAQRLSQQHSSSWYRELEWCNAMVRVSEPEHPAAFIMVKEA